MKEQTQPTPDLGYKIYPCTYRIIGADGDRILSGKVSIGKNQPDEKSDDYQDTIYHFLPGEVEKSETHLIDSDNGSEIEILSIDGYKPETFQIPDHFPIADYYPIPGSHYVLLRDGNVARMLKPCIVKGREYINIKFGGKIKRVSRRWILAQIAGTNL